MPGSGQGMGIPQIEYRPTDLTPNGDVHAQVAPGTEVDYLGNRFIYVQHDQGTDVVVTAAGQPAFWKNSTTAVATPDHTSAEVGAAIPAGCCGIYQGAITHLNFTWLQKRGLMAGVLLDGNGAVGNWVGCDDADIDTLHTVTLATAGADGDIAAAPRVGIQITAPGGSIGTVLLEIP